MWLLEQTEGRGLTEQIDANGGFTPINRAASPRSPWPGVAPAGVRSALFSIIHSAYTPFIHMRAPFEPGFLIPNSPRTGSDGSGSAEPSLAPKTVGRVPTGVVGSWKIPVSGLRRWLRSGSGWGLWGWTEKIPSSWMCLPSKSGFRLGGTEPQEGGSQSPGEQQGNHRPGP